MYNSEQQQLRHLKMQVQRQLTQSLALANRHFNCEFAVPKISYSVRGVKAGVAYLQQWEIRLNPTLLLENQHSFIQQVVPHELAHLIVYQQYGRVRPHGKEWQFVMEQVLGVRAETYHNFCTQSVRGKTFSYQCQCQTHQLSIRRHNKIQQQSAVYFCRKCQTALRYLNT